MDQPFAELARQVLEVQSYPDLREYPEGPPEQPYDAAGWTLGYQMGVRIVEATEPLTESVREVLREVAVQPLTWDADVEDAAPFDAVPGVGFDDHPVAAGIRPAPGRITGSGGALRLDPAQNNTFRALNAAWDHGANVSYDAAGTDYVVSGLGDADARRLVEDLSLQATRGPVGGTPLARPRVGLYRPWTASMDEGWTRWLLENHGFEFANLANADVRAGELAGRYDVIVLPADRPTSLLEGFARGSVPPRYSGGLGEVGVRALDAFVRDGGTLLCMNQASDLCISELHLPVTNVTDGLGRDVFFSSGSLLEARMDDTHPVMAGMPERGAIFFDRSPVFLPGDDFEGAVLAQYAPEGSPLLSGYLLGEEHLQGLAAAVDVRHGEGHVILLGFRPQWRGQPRSTFRVLFNSVLFHGAMSAEAEGADGFWARPEKWSADEPIG